MTLDWGPETSDAMEDVADEAIRIHRTPSCAPHRALAFRRNDTLRGRLLNRMVGAARHFDWIGLSDEPRWWGLSLIPAAKKIIRSRDVELVVATGGPFLTNYWAARLKEAIPTVPLIQEFRDPWTDRLSAIGRHGREMSVAVERERRVVLSADSFVTVSDTWGDVIREKRPGLDVYVVPNGYDPEDYVHAGRLRQDIFRIIHTGRPFAGREQPLRAFLTAVRRLHPHTPLLAVDFYGGFPDPFLSEFSDLLSSGIVRAHPPVPPKAVPGLLADSVLCLHLNAAHTPGALSTKIYEYAAAGRPVFSMNYGGEVDALINAHALGWSVNATTPDFAMAALAGAYETWRAGGLVEWHGVGVERFSLDSLARDYAEIMGHTAAKLDQAMQR